MPAVVNSGTKKKRQWWQKLVWSSSNKSSSSSSQQNNIQRWKNLSPDNPPLSFLVAQPTATTFKSSEPDQPTSEIAPTDKNHEFIPSASLYISHQDPLYHRDLYTIAELSETNTTNSFAASSSHDHPSFSDTTTTLATSSSDGNVLPVVVLPPPASPAVVVVVEQPSSSSVVTQPPPVVKPSSTDELETNILFRQMLQLRINDKDYPKKLRLLFNDQNNLEYVLFTAIDGTQQKIRFKGTPQSIPPELLKCDRYNHELTSVWVLGILLYHMLVGKYPFDNKHVVTHVELFNRMLVDPNFVVIMPDTLSAQAQDLLKHMLTPDPTKRATFAFIQSHPWFIANKPTKKTKRKKALQFVKKVTNFVFKGPYPPPPP
ncbi:kinase-like domain-containing protein [Helicostylum pulchrum]|nr:kinase-like domain-containing protein [Helicostylum pulchrum]